MIFKTGSEDIGVLLHRAGVLVRVAIIVFVCRVVAAGHSERGDSNRQRHQHGHYPFRFHLWCVPFVVVFIEL